MQSPMTHKATQDVVKAYLSGHRGGKSGLWTPEDARNPNPRLDPLVTHPNQAYVDKPLTVDDVNSAIDALWEDARRFRESTKAFPIELEAYKEALRASKWTPETFRREYLGEFVPLEGE